MTDERATPLARTQATAFCDNTFAKKNVGPLAEGGANREINVGRVPPFCPWGRPKYARLQLGTDAGARRLSMRLRFREHTALVCASHAPDARFHLSLGR